MINSLKISERKTWIYGDFGVPK